MTGRPGAVDAAARQAVEALVHRHAWLIDRGQAGEVAELYTEDAVLTGIGPEKRGRAAIAAWASAREAMTGRRSRHVQTNLLVEDGGDGLLTGHVTLTLYRHDGEGGAPTPMLVGDYSDRYRLGADGAWRIAERRLTVAFGAA